MNRKIIDKAASYVEANNMVTDGDKIVVGVSGGADSVCLLFLLCGLKEKYSLSLHAVHINHGIREEAGEDAAFVEDICRKWGITCDVIEEDVPARAKEWKMSEEEAGRKVRYDAFSEAARKYGCSKIAVAHNMNDEAETVLFHMFRGSGLHGLTGIPAVRQHGDVLIIRPILCLNRTEIEEVLNDNGIGWVTDKTNLEDVYARNRIRHNILPEAEEIASGAVKHICEAAGQLAETEKLLEELEAVCMADCRHAENEDVGEAVSMASGEVNAAGEDGPCRDAAHKIVLNAVKLANYHTVIKKRVILRCLKDISSGGKDIGALQVEQVLELIDRVGNRSINLARGISAKRSYDTIVMFPTATDDNISAEAEGGIEAGVNIEYMTVEECGMDIDSLMEKVTDTDALNKYTKWLDYDRIDGQLEVRSRKTGDYLLIQNAFGEYVRKSLKDYMIDVKIPAAERDSIPVVACGNHCVWLVGYRISDSCKITPQTTKLVRLSCK